MRHKLAIAVFSGFFLFILWVIFLANTGQTSIFFELVRAIPYGDKVGHFFLFGLLTLLANLAVNFRMLSIGKLKVFWGTAAVFAFVTFEELSQYFVPSRTLDIYDYSADMVAIVVFTWLSACLAKRNPARDFS